MIRSLFGQFFLVLLLNSVSAELTVSSSCKKECGTVSIPYPFGIGYGCYHNEWFEVHCNKSVPFLTKINKQVVQINTPRPIQHGEESVPLGSLRIKARVTSMGCSDGEKPEELFNFTGTPFSMSHNNTLVAFGCNSKATLTHIDPRIVGCFSTWDGEKELLTFLEKSCYGFKCCNASIPEEVGQVTGVKLESRDGNTTRGGCNTAFLTDEYNEASPPWGDESNPKWFHERQYSTVQLNWYVMTTNTSFDESLKCGDISLSDSFDDFPSRPCYCGVTDIPDDHTYLWCACNSGYEGNPYLPDGCKDINDCARSPCFSGETCLDAPGGYECVRIKETKTFQIHIIGVSVGLTVFLVGVAIWGYKRIKKHRKSKLRKKFFNRNGGLLLQRQLTSGEGSLQNTKVFSSKELEKATESFSSERVLGQGGQGTVFKGMLADGRIVAVKKATELDEDKVEQFINEVVILSQVNHRNVVKILGCCLETKVPLLVYEFIPNGSLFQHLHGEALEDHSTTASASAWELRLQIAIDIARALCYLHCAASAPIFHKDIKSANIMLDENNRGKLADFGTSRVLPVDHSHLTTDVLGNVSGTGDGYKQTYPCIIAFGYIDPEYLQSSRFNEKSDVYSFGIVLAELVSGQKAVCLDPSGGNRSLAKYFLLAMEENRLSDIIDPRIRASCDLEQVTVLAKIARLCLNLNGEKRPNMREISMELERSSSHPELLTMGNEEEQVAPFKTGRESFNIDVASTSTSQYDSAMWSDDQPLNPPQTF